MRYITEAGNTFDPDTKILYSNWNEGFFSNATTTLWSLIKLADKGIEPIEIKTEFGWKKYLDSDSETDAFAKFFAPCKKEIQVPLFHSLPWLCQHSDYSKTMKDFKPFVKKWFNPHEYIKELGRKLVKDYNINLEKTIGVFRRVTDKQGEITLASLNDFLDATKSLLQQHPDHKIFLQTDDTQTVNEFKSNFKENCIVVKEIPTSSKQVGIHYQINSNKEMHGNLMLAVTLILSRCNVILNSSSNIGLWIYLYRNVYNGNEFQFSCMENSIGKLIKNDFL